MKHLSCGFKAIVFCTVVSLYFLVLLAKDDLSRYFQVDAPNPPPSVIDPGPTTYSVSDSNGTLVPSPSWTKHRMYKCTPNHSVGSLKGFSGLPTHIQDFLLYRHCRRFRPLLDVPKKCGRTPEDSDAVFLLLVIKTLPWNYNQREVLRRTWAAERVENGASIRRVFLAGTVGAPGDEARRHTDELLATENRRYSDILQWDFHDSFFNLTLKQLLFLEWMRERCPQARYILNGDEDVFANTDNIIRYLQAEDNPRHGGEKHLYVGQVLQNTKPVRWTKSKYYIPPQVYEADVFPPYCTGGGFLISGYSAQVMYNMSFVVPVIPIDDAYLGMCLEKAGVKPRHHVGVLAVGEKVVPKRIYTMDPCLYQDLIVAHGFKPHEILVMWDRIHNRELKCAISSLSSFRK
ncbi:hypothetical protein JZ751_029743 [Albula glossodonta]|uniref:Hexosyltransferase n=1 Tax=Albula glossodonta TaxID=121402 RepID=A0A8T2NHK3_9TELE|nr:hypothetical protein JZ751_029743 [Albula glossodonta]